MKITNGIKGKQLPPSKSRGKKAPNPTNFSNLRSQMYLSHDGALSNTGPLNGKAEGKIASELSKLGLPSPYTKLKPNVSLEISPEESKTVTGMYPTTTPKKSPGMFPHTTKATSDGEMKQFWTERPPAKTGFGPVRIQRMEKLQPKLLPISNESLIDASLVSSTNGGNVENEKERTKGGEIRVDICLYDKGSPETEVKPNNGNSKPPTIPLASNKKAQNSPPKSEDKKAKAKRSRSEHRQPASPEKDIAAVSNTRKAIERNQQEIINTISKGMDSIKLFKQYWEIPSTEDSLAPLNNNVKLRPHLKKSLHLEPTVMALGQYVMTSQLIPACCTTIVKDMLSAAHRNSGTFCQLLQRHVARNSKSKTSTNDPQVSPRFKQDESESIKANNTAIIAALKTLCEILKEHNKTFTRSSSESNIAVGAALQTVEEIEVHTSIVNGVNTVLKNLEKSPPISETHRILTSSLEASLVALQQAALSLQLFDSVEEPLPIVDPPYLPSTTDLTSPYTLVLDLDETLVHYQEIENDGRILVRPGAEEFLEEMGKYYEVVVFTAALQDYADWVLDQLDINRNIKYRLYRQHALPYGQNYIKDLSRVGRPLNRMMIVDNLAENFQLQPENGIMIKSWTGDPQDTALYELSPILAEIVRKEVDDVREALAMFSAQMAKQNEEGAQEFHFTLEDA